MNHLARNTWVGILSRENFQFVCVAEGTPKFPLKYFILRLGKYVSIIYACIYVQLIRVIWGFIWVLFWVLFGVLYSYKQTHGHRNTSVKSCKGTAVFPIDSKSLASTDWKGGKNSSIEFSGCSTNHVPPTAVATSKSRQSLKWEWMGWSSISHEMVIPWSHLRQIDKNCSKNFHVIQRYSKQRNLAAIVFAVSTEGKAS